MGLFDFLFDYLSNVPPRAGLSNVVVRRVCALVFVPNDARWPPGLPRTALTRVAGGQALRAGRCDRFHLSKSNVECITHSYRNVNIIVDG